VACKHWRWMNGMLTLSGWRRSEQMGAAMPDSFFYDQIPDLSDPATLGCLLHLVMQACGRGLGMNIRNDGIDNEAQHYVACLENADKRRATLESLGWVNG